MGFLDRFTNWNDDEEQEKLEEGLDKTRDSFFGKLDRMVRGKDTVDAEVLDESSSPATWAWTRRST